MMPRFNFSSYYLNESLSDVTLLIRIDGDVKQRLPGHGVVLANVSRVFQEQIEQQQGPGGRPCICLDVQYDQVPAASALVRFVYTGHLPEPSPEQHSLLVHMLHLAHTFGVTDCEAACYSELIKCSTLQPAALGLAFHLLSPSQASTPGTEAAAAAHDTAAGFETLLKHCLDQLQQQLGDMEAVLSCPESLSQLQSLPLPALLALLHDERTAAASENTVVAVVHCWMTAAAQRDVRVDATQREQLAAAVRLPLLEPCYLATVVPRMTWLTEILGVQGLATMAGVARALCDPHAEPILGSTRACGPLAAGWMQGPRPLPSSCSRAMHGGPALTINWCLPLSDVEAAFEAACADAASRALAEQQQREAAAAAAAAAAAQAALVSTEAPGWGLGGFRSPLAPATAAAAVSAVASAAAAAAALWNKRKRSPAASQSFDEGGRDQQSSSTAAVGAGRGNLQQRGSEPDDDADVAKGTTASQQDPQEQLLAAEQPTPGSQRRGEAEQQKEQGDRSSEDDMPRHAHKRRRRGPAPSEGAAAAAAAAGGCRAAAGAGASTPKRGSQAALRSSQGPRDAQQLSPQAAGQAGAGGSRAAQAAGLGGAAGFFSQDASAAAAAGAGAAGARSLTPVAGEGSLSSGVQQQQRTFKLRSQAVQFAGYSWRMVLYFQPKEARDAASTGPTDAAGEQAGVAAAGRSAGSSKGHGGAKGCQAVAAAHAVKLPDEPKGASAAAVCAGDWTARLALEAWPAVNLPPGVSTAACSSSLAVQLGGARPAAAAAAGPKRAGGLQPAGPSHHRQGRSRAAASPGAMSGPGPRASGGSHDVASSPSRRHERVGSSPARYTGPKGATAAAGGSGRSPAGRQRVAGGARGARADGCLTAIPESDDDDEQQQQEAEEGEEEQGQQQQSWRRRRQQQRQQEEQGCAPSDSGCSSEEEQQESEHEPSHVPDSEDDEEEQDHDDDGVQVVGEFPSAPRPAGRGRPRSGSRSKQQQRGVRTAGQRAAAVQQQQAEAVTPGAPAGAGDAEDEDDNSSWRVLHLPQGSWLKSRRCDTGFTSFFSITLKHGVWDPAAWQQYLQPGQLLQLRAKVWNVR